MERPPERHCPCGRRVRLVARCGTRLTFVKIQLGAGKYAWDWYRFERLTRSPTCRHCRHTMFPTPELRHATVSTYVVSCLFQVLKCRRNSLKREKIMQHLINDVRRRRVTDLHE